MKKKTERHAGRLILLAMLLAACLAGCGSDEGAEVARGGIETSDGVILAQSSADGETAGERLYPQAPLAAQVVGRLEPAVSGQAAALRGVSGLEEQYDAVLQRGEHLVLTMDYALQAALDAAFQETIEALGQKRQTNSASAGAAVLMEADSGRVLALVSWPELGAGDVNRAVQASYEPGSVFKIVTAAAALEAGVVNPDEEIYNPGQYWEAPYIGSAALMGFYNLSKAIAKSDNVYFQEIGRRAGWDSLTAAAEALGFGEVTGIDLPGETVGVPLSALEAGDGLETTLQASIGHGGQEVTVMQMAVATAAVINGGKVYQPYLVERIIDADGKIVVENEPQLKKAAAFSAETLAAIEEAMVAAASEGGNAYGRFYEFPAEIRIGAKTGTAVSQDSVVEENGWPQQYFDGLFVAFTAIEGRDIVFAGVVEKGYSGSGSAGVVCQKVFEACFGLPSGQ